MISHTYDPAGAETCTSQDASGATCSSGAPASKVTSTYYLDGQVRSVDDGSATSSPAGHYNRFAYDGSGSTVLRSDGVDGTSTSYATTYGYGDAGLATSQVSAAAAGKTTSFGYDAAGRPASETDPNGLVNTYCFNADDTLASLTLATASTSCSSTPTNPVASWSYSYDNNYRITSQSLTATGAGGATPLTAKFQYGYDKANRLTSFTNGTNAAQTLTYDANSNRTQFGSQKSTYNADNSIANATDQNGANPTNYSYDVYGRLTLDSCATYNYDGFDRLTGVSLVTSPPASCANTKAATYTYDGLDRQVTSTVSGTTTAVHYDGTSSQVSDQTSGSTDTIYELGAGNEPMALTVESSSPTTQYLATDGQGNISTVTGTTGSVACTVRYDPFGTPLGGAASATSPCNTGSTSDAFFYRGERLDLATGDYQLGSRTYDPSKASFLTPDTQRAGVPSDSPSVGADPLTLNTYSYVNGDPINLADPTGQMPSWLRRVLHKAHRLLHHLVHGARRIGGKIVRTAGQVAIGFGQGTWAMAKGLFDLGSQVARCLACAVFDIGKSIIKHPMATLKSLVDYSDFAKGNIARGIGHLLPSVLAALAGGAGAASKVADAGAAADEAGTAAGVLSKASRLARRGPELAESGTSSGVGTLARDLLKSVQSRVAISETGEVTLGQSAGRASASALEADASVAAGGAAEAESTGLTRVGRWMSPEEHLAMEETGMVQPGRVSPQVSVAHPADVEAYMQQAAPGSRYVEFDVPESSLVPGGKEGWATIPGPDSIFSRLAVQRGLPPYSYPPALNIEWLASRIPW